MGLLSSRRPAGTGHGKVGPAARAGGRPGATLLAFTLLAVTLLGVAGLGVALLPAAPAAAAGDSDVSRLTKSFQKCADEAGSADVLLLMDQSRSLRDSDPDGERAVAAREFVGRLARYSEDSGVPVRVKISGFEGDYRPGTWHDLGDDAGATAARADVASAVREDGLETDYWNALEGARKDLRAGAACKFLIFFTDGEYDVDGSYGPTKPYTDIDATVDGKAAEQAGQDSLCSAKQGPMNGLRAAGVYVAAIGLTGEEKADLSFLKRVTTGSKGCGGKIRADHSAYLPVADAGALVFELTGVVDPPIEVPFADGQIKFGLDSYITEASVLADAGTSKGGIRIGLAGPRGKTQWARPGVDEFRIAGVEVEVNRISDRTVRFELDMPDSGEGFAGTWAVKFEASNPEALPEDVLARASITVIADLQPVWTNPVDTADVGSTLPMTIAVRNSDGQDIEAALPNARITVGYRSNSGTVVADLASGSAEDFAAGVDVPLDQPGTVNKPLAPGKGKLTARLEVSTVAKPPTPLRPTASSYQLRLKTPTPYPVVDDTPLTLAGPQGPVAEGLVPSTGTIPVTGPGCAWIDRKASDESVNALPAGTADVALATSAGRAKECLKLADGQAGHLDLSVTPSSQGNGSIEGTVVVMAAPADGSAPPIEVPVTYTAERIKEPAVVPGVAAFVIGLLLGLGIPAGLLVWTRARSARIPVSHPVAGYLHHSVANFVLDGDNVLDAATREPLAIDRRAIIPVHTGTEQTVKSVQAAEVTMSARPLGNPFSVPHVLAERPGTAVLSDAGGPDERGRARMPLSLQGHWVAWATGPQDFTVLMLFANGDAHDRLLPDLSTRFRDSLSRNAQALRMLGQAQHPQAAAVHSGAPPADDWGSGATTGPAGSAGAGGAPGARPDNMSGPAGDDWGPDPADWS